MVNVSAIIPAYKRIEQTLKTIALLQGSEGLNMDFSLEIIVADSTPDSSLREAIQKKFGDKIIYLQPEHSGIAANKNAGAKEANGDVLIFVDSDIEVEPVTLKNTVAALKAHPEAAAISGEVIWRGGLADGSLDRPRPEDRLFVVDQTTFIEAIYSRYIATYKEVFLEVGGYDEAVFNMRGEGADLSIRYWRSGFPLGFDKSLRVYHIHDAPDSAALRVPHKEWDIARDLLLLGYKYDLFSDNNSNFAKTVQANFQDFGSDSGFEVLQGIGHHLSEVVGAKQALDVYKTSRSLYQFKFLEVFTQKELVRQCISEAAVLIRAVREKTFPKT